MKTRALMLFATPVNNRRAEPCENHCCRIHMNNEHKWTRRSFAAAIAGSATTLAQEPVASPAPPAAWKGLCAEDKSFWCCTGTAVGKIPMSVPELHASGKKLEDWIKRDGSAPLTFRAAGPDSGVTLKPLNQLWGRYATYWTVS